MLGERRKMAEQTVTPGLYRHFKGNTYLVIGVGRHTESNEVGVVYHRADPPPEESPPMLFFRPYEMFFDRVEHDGERIARFARI
jgi:hypothetical protein